MGCPQHPVCPCQGWGPCWEHLWVQRGVALVLPWHLVLILSGTMKGAVPGETGDGDVADGEMGKDGRGGTPELLLSALHRAPGLSIWAAVHPSRHPFRHVSLQAGGYSGTFVQHSYLPVLGCPQSKGLG